MLTSTAVKHFGTQAGVAKAIGISRASVNNWPKVVPYDKARALEIVTYGALKVDESLYPVLRVARDLLGKSA